MLHQCIGGGIVLADGPHIVGRDYTYRIQVAVIQVITHNAPPRQTREVCGTPR
jgi:hypothetical protein